MPRSRVISGSIAFYPVSPALSGHPLTRQQRYLAQTLFTKRPGRFGFYPYQVAHRCDKRLVQRPLDSGLVRTSVRAEMFPREVAYHLDVAIVHAT